MTPTTETRDLLAEIERLNERAEFLESENCGLFAERTSLKERVRQLEEQLKRLAAEHTRELRQLERDAREDMRGAAAEATWRTREEYEGY